MSETRFSRILNLLNIPAAYNSGWNVHASWDRKHWPGHQRGFTHQITEYFCIPGLQLRKRANTTHFTSLQQLSNSKVLSAFNFTVQWTITNISGYKQQLFIFSSRLYGSAIWAGLDWAGVCCQQGSFVCRLALGWGKCGNTVLCLSSPRRLAWACSHPEVKGFLAQQVGKHQHRSVFQASACAVFPNASLVQSSFMPSWFKEWRNELHFWRGRSTISQCKDVHVQGRGKNW